MEHRETIEHKDHLLQALSLCIEIQNAGIATIFPADFYGHVNKMSIRLHFPKWVSESQPDVSLEIYGCGEDFIGHNNEQLKKLSEILLAGQKDLETQLQEIETKERKIRREQYEALKKEFESA